jgi:hypothetical protein
LIVFAYFFYIETKGRTIEEVSRLFDSQKESVEGMTAESRDDAVSLAELGKEKVEMIDDSQKRDA